MYIELPDPDDLTIEDLTTVRKGITLEILRLQAFERLYDDMVDYKKRIANYDATLRGDSEVMVDGMKITTPSAEKLQKLLVEQELRRDLKRRRDEADDAAKTIGDC